MLGGLTVLAQKDRPPRAPADGDHPLRLLYTLPGDSQIRRAARRAHGAARIWVQNAYLTSDLILDELIAAHDAASTCGLSCPSVPTPASSAQQRARASLMLRHGIRVITPACRVKAAVFDGWACLGSANFDRLSLRLNRETNIATSEAAAVDAVEQLFEPDFARALELREPLPSGWLDYLKEIVADQLWGDVAAST